MQLAPVAIPQAESEHPLDGFESVVQSPRLDRTQEHLGVRASPEHDTGRLEPFSEGTEIVDLAVEVEDEATPMGHRPRARIPNQTPRPTAGRTVFINARF